MQITGFTLASIYFFYSFNTFNFGLLQSSIWLIVAIAVFQVIAYLSFYKGLETGLVSIVSPVGPTFAAITVILSVIFYQEHLSTLQTVSVGLVMVSVVLVALDLTKLRKTKRLVLISGVKQGLIASFGWGVSLFLLVKASNDLGWFLPAYTFRLVAILFLVVLSFFQRKTLKIPNFSKNIFYLIPVGFFDISAFFSYSFGVLSEYASIVATVSGAFTIITVFLALIFLKERLNLNQLTGIGGVILGITLLSI